MSTAPAVRPITASEIQPAPTSFGGLLRQLGPGLIITSIIVGSGELIVTPKLGAEIGFRLLWFIIVGCLLKVFVQIELGRYAITRGRTTLEALNTLPGPRVLVSWVLWIWLAMYICLVPQVAGMVGGTATAFQLGGADISVSTLAMMIGASCAILLVIGRYGLIEWLSTALVAGFTITTLVAVIALQFTPYAITGAQLASGFSFHLPADLATAFGAFGLIGVGASELIYYPYWCLEKGYARKLGPDDGTAAWKTRAAAWLKVMRVDAWTSFVLYTTTTIAFYLLGAAVLHAKQLRVESAKMIETLSFMYRDTFGEWSLWLFLVGAVGRSLLHHFRSNCLERTSARRRDEPVWREAVQGRLASRSLGKNLLCDSARSLHERLPDCRQSRESRLHGRDRPRHDAAVSRGRRVVFPFYESASGTTRTTRLACRTDHRGIRHGRPWWVSSRRGAAWLNRRAGVSRTHSDECPDTDRAIKI